MSSLCLPLNTTIDISNIASSDYLFIVNGTSYNTKTYKFKLDVGTYNFSKLSQHPISFIGLPDGVTITDNNGAINSIAFNC